MFVTTLTMLLEASIAREISVFSIAAEATANRVEAMKAESHSILLLLLAILLPSLCPLYHCPFSTAPSEVGIGKNVKEKLHNMHFSRFGGLSSLNWVLSGRPR